MKFVISKDHIQKAMQHVGSAIDPKGVILPILSYVKITASDGKLFLVATNLETEASDCVNCNVLESGSLAIPTTTVTEIIKKIPNSSEICFEVVTKSDDNSCRLVVSSGRSKFEVNSLSDSDFPAVFGSDFDSEVSIKVKDLLLAIKTTIFAVSSRPENYSLTGLLFHTMTENSENYLCTVATDGHRLSFFRSKIDSAIVIPNRIIPKKSIVDLNKTLSDYEQDSNVVIRFGEKRASFCIDTFKYTTKLLDADFPDYNRVVPKSNNKVVEVGRDGLLSALERVSILYKIGGVRGVKFLVDCDRLYLTSSSGFGDVANEDIECVFSEKDGKFETSYNPDFIIEALNVCTGNKVSFNLLDPSAPILIKSDYQNAYHVVMPMKF